MTTERTAVEVPEIAGKNNFVGELAHQSIRIAIHGAQQFLKLANANVNPEALRHFVKEQCKAALDGALHDAELAFEAGMTQVAAATFSASMVLAGIAAAKLASDPKSSMILLNCDIAVCFGKQKTREAASWGTRRLQFNVPNLGGVGWFDLNGNRLAIDDLIIHEFGHHFESNHLSDGYYSALTMLASKAIQAAREGKI